ncbi:DNA methyltransferase [Elizabethkingia anophelis]|nr:site-specific DNA-methyltransferase [Elizabethkingia anophelis]ELB1894347.1 site-specific DNA-methyltransferase [Elizabethkingia anophelis]
MQITDKITITNEDNMELMARYPDGYFDLAIVDPPYGIGEDWKKRKNTSKKYKGAYNNESIPDKKYFNELMRVSKNWIVWGWNYYTDFFSPTNYLIIWDKKVPEQTAFYSQVEIAATNIKIPAAIYRHSWDGARKELETGVEKIHPHQKPIALYKWLLGKYAKPGDKILDTHIGSGSIAIACHDFGYELTACEIDNIYFDSACKRIKHYIAFNQSLFHPEELTQTLF